MSAIHHATADILMFHCPGCDEPHNVRVRADGGQDPAHWGWNLDLDRPTFTPSILVTAGGSDPVYRCHSFVTDGRIRFLDDCSHAHKGQTVDLPEWPAELSAGPPGG